MGEGQDTALGLQPHSPPFLLSQDDPGRMHLPKFQAQTSPRPCSLLPPIRIPPCQVHIYATENMSEIRNQAYLHTQLKRHT